MYDYKPCEPDELPAELDIDYSEARPNRFAVKGQDKGLTVVIDPDVAEVFATSESVNNVLRALIENMPNREKANRSDGLQAA